MCICTYFFYSSSNILYQERPLTVLFSIFSSLIGLFRVAFCLRCPNESWGLVARIKGRSQGKNREKRTRETSSLTILQVAPPSSLFPRHIKTQLHRHRLPRYLVFMMTYQTTKKNIGTQSVQELFFW